ncbi:hypothetical protein GGF46_003055 [Coemansia sp. RSA 552]|nr:hypothetical protein GGF46_003055 [Coemansia sp. RSA 552]
MAVYLGAGVGATLKGSTLVLPTVSVGNVPQLAVDLLINTLRARQIGTIDSPSLAPMSGRSGFDHQPTQRAVPLEVYQSADAKWTIVQQRSMPLARHHRLFAQEMMDFIKQQEFGRVVLLTSSDAAFRQDELIDGPQIRSLAVNWSDDELATRLKKLSLGSLAPATHAGSSPAQQLPVKQLYSSGIAKELLRLGQMSDVPIIALVALVYEGDNVPDAISMATAANALLEIDPAIKRWVPPHSWKWLMAPGSAPSELF